MPRHHLTSDDAARLRATIAMAADQRGACDLAEARAAVTSHATLQRQFPEDAQGLAEAAWAVLKADHLARLHARKQAAAPHGPRDAA